ncbi:DUF2490 domain-containing protein [Prolixibacteraceae bacterium JC049]|nr:DUF2490 domain-containing protein [Prolixibacteraceae bacterium JC049]
MTKINNCFLSAKNFLILLLTLACLSGTAQNKSNRHEGWITLSASKKVADKWKVNLTAHSQNRLDHGSYVNFIQAGVSYNLSSGLYFSGQYRLEESKKPSEWISENRIQAIAGYKWKLGNWKFRNRYRLEFRKFANKSLKYRHRADIDIKIPTSVFKTYTPYFNQELQFSDKVLSRTRSYVGITGKGKLVVPSVYLLWQTDKRDWGRQNTFGLGVKLDFKL